MLAPSEQRNLCLAALGAAESQPAGAVKSQNLSQVDDRISVERIISVEGFNRRCAEQLSSLRLMQTKPLMSPCSKEPRGSGHTSLAAAQLQSCWAPCRMQGACALTMVPNSDSSPAPFNEW